MDARTDTRPRLESDAAAHFFIIRVRDQKRFPVSPTRPQGLIIGRKEALVDIVVKEKSVSARHFRIFYKEATGANPESLYIEDLSSNGTFRNDRQIEKGVEHILRQGDYIACHVSLTGRYQDEPDSFLVDLTGATQPKPAPKRGYEPFDFQQLSEEAQLALEAGELDVEDDHVVEKKPKASRAIAWLRGDLRFTDNPIINACPKLGEKDPRGLPLFIFDRRLHSPDVATLDFPTLSHYGGTIGTGSRKMGLRKARFLIESVLELRDRLLNAESNLLILIGHSEELLSKLVYEYEASAIHVTRNDAPLEAQVDAEVRKSLYMLYGTRVELKRHWGAQTMHHLDDLPPGFLAPRRRGAHGEVLHGFPGAYVKYQKIIEDNDVRVRPVGDYAVGGLKVDTKGLQDCRRVSQELDAYVQLTFDESTWSDASEREREEARAVDLRTLLKALGYDVNKLPVDTDLERLRDDMEDLKRGLEDQTREVVMTYGKVGGKDMIAKLEQDYERKLQALQDEYRIAYTELKACPRGGELAALAALRKLVRKGFHGHDAVVHGETAPVSLDPWLYTGCLSARHVWFSFERAEETTLEVADFSWDLRQASFLRLFGHFSGAHLFGEKSIGGPGSGREYRATEAAEQDLTNWMTGTLGVPVIDAHMRQLRSLGLMAAMGRHLCARYLVEELRVDWRRGAAHFQEFLLGDDPWVTWGEFARAAGVAGTDSAPVKALDLDGYQVSECDLRFIRTWCPEYSQEDLRKPTFAKRAAPKTLNRTGKAEKGKEGKGKGKGKGKRYPAGGSPAGLPSAEMLDAMDKSTKVVPKGRKEAAEPDVSALAMQHPMLMGKTKKAPGQEHQATEAKTPEGKRHHSKEEAKASPKHQSKEEAKASPKHQSKDEAKASPKPQSKDEAKASPKPQSKDEAKASPKHQSKAEAKASPKKKA